MKVPVCVGLDSAAIGFLVNVLPAFKKRFIQHMIFLNSKNL